MKTPLRTLPALVALVLAAALIGASCSSVTPQAVVVDDWTLSEEDFLGDLASIADNEVYLDVRAAQNQPVRTQGQTRATYSTRFTAEFLNERVTFALATQENRSRGLPVEDVDIREAEALLSQSMSRTPSGDANRAAPDGLAVLDGFSANYRDALIDGVANLLVLQRDIVERSGTEEGLRALYDAQQGQGGVEQACARHILIQAGSGAAPPTEEQYAAALQEVQALSAQLDAGADFAVLARQSSDDPGSAEEGGALGCQRRGAYVAAFDEAVWSQPLDGVGDPVRTDFGYHLVVVDARGQLSFEDLRPQLARAVEQNQGALLSDWLRQAAADADVWVDPKLGRWEPEAAQVVPPPGADQPSAAESADLAELLGGTGAG